MPILVQSVSTSRPVRSFCESTRASLDRMRCVSSAWPISSEKISTGFCAVLRDVRRDAEAERGLAHRGSGADDVERARLEAGEDLVEVGVARGGAGDDVAAVERLLEVVHRLGSRSPSGRVESVTRSSATSKTLVSASSSALVTSSGSR